MHHQEHDADEKQHPRNLRRDRRHTSDAQSGGDETHDQEHEAVIQHGSSSCVVFSCKGRATH